MFVTCSHVINENNVVLVAEVGSGAGVAAPLVGLVYIGIVVMSVVVLADAVANIGAFRVIVVVVIVVVVIVIVCVVVCVIVCGAVRDTIAAGVYIAPIGGIDIDVADVVQMWFSVENVTR